MRTLLLDTSTERGVVGVAESATLLHEQALPADRRHARDLVPAMQAAVQSVGWKLRSVELLVVSAGPGSYTGLRVGISAVKALALVNNARIVALDSLEVVANQAGVGDRIVAVADAQQQRIYTATFAKSSEPIATRVAPTTLEFSDDWLASLLPGDVVTGPAVARWERLISPECRIVSAEHRSPKAESLLMLALRDAAEGRFADLRSLEPIYLRPSAAEEKLTFAGELARP
jgi:tRNA threonylcarbamoyladenosine biosynthesis protein TsaB